MRTIIVGDFKSGIGISIDCRLIYKAYVENIRNDEVVYKIDTCMYAHDELSEYENFQFQNKDTVIYCMPLFDVWRLFLTSGIRGNFNKVLIFQWELKKIDKSLISITSIFHKVYTISEFIASGMRKYDKRISSIILPFDVKKYKIRGFNQNDNFVRFYYIMDWNSFASRKNPDVLISAFKKFKHIEKKALLTIKFNNISADQLLEKYGDVSEYDITLISKMMSHDEYLKFVLNQDVLVSPHKSEGFGRVIGEAIMHGHFIVATKYGGVLDYLDSNNSLLVSGNLKNVKSNDYFSYSRNKWMEISEDDILSALVVAYRKIKDNKIDFKRNKMNFENKYNLFSFYEDIQRKLNDK